MQPALVYRLFETFWQLLQPQRYEDPACTLRQFRLSSFQRRNVKLARYWAKKVIILFCVNCTVTSRQKMGIILEYKVFQKLNLSKGAPKLIYFN
jgi:hypothetical protein